MIKRMSKKDVISQLESLKIEADHMCSCEKSDEIFKQDATALEAAIYYLKEKRKDDVSIIKYSLALAFIIQAIIFMISIFK
ncbi:hypothetical protein [Clostridium sp. C2-6-12]|uniref:hypothetical protein n=1 Tax=Clostridium sp. C2-6-12 TaxID=2698832 RepID=UPI001370513F|nr:hypothetical protein [Clostridium sp. C2-6-12]